MKDNCFEVEYRYDFSSDILAVKVKEKYIYCETIEMDDRILLDFDTNNVPVSLEILDASRVFNIPKSNLKNIFSFNMNVSITEKFISINIVLGILIHERKEDSIFEKLTDNYTNIPSIEMELVSA